MPPGSIRLFMDHSETTSKLTDRFSTNIHTTICPIFRWTVDTESTGFSNIPLFYNYLQIIIVSLLLVCYLWSQKTGLTVENTGISDMALWKKGESGNLKGRPRKRLFDDYLREALAAKRGAAAKRLVERLIGEAAMGNVHAMKLVCERIGGKPRTAEDAAVVNGDELTLSQVRTKLAELLSRPEVKRNLQSLLAGSDEPKTDTIQ